MLCLNHFGKGFLTLESPKCAGKFPVTEEHKQEPNNHLDCGKGIQSEMELGFHVCVGLLELSKGKHIPSGLHNRHLFIHFFFTILEAASLESGCGSG